MFVEFAISLLATTMPTRSDLPAKLSQAPRLGIGLAALGRPGYINLGHAEDLAHTERSVEAMRTHAHEVLDAAYELGIRYFDCARSYGLSEDFVSSWLALNPMAAKDVVVGSKWGYEYTAKWRVNVEDGEAHEVKKHTAEQLAHQLEETRALLPRLDLYQIHSATQVQSHAKFVRVGAGWLRHKAARFHACAARSQESGVLESPAVLEALAALRSDCPVGLSVSHPQVPTIEQAVGISHGDAPLFGAVQATLDRPRGWL